MDPKDTTVYLTDAQIRKLTSERKVISRKKDLTNFKSLLGVLKGSEVKMIGENGNIFEIRCRFPTYNEDDFSIIISVNLENINDTFRLRRYDGIDTHKNKISGNTIGLCFHIHYATESYQNLAFGKHDGYAECTDKYKKLSEAIKVAVDECNIVFDDIVENQEELI